MMSLNICGRKESNPLAEPSLKFEIKDFSSSEEIGPACEFLETQLVEDVVDVLTIAEIVFYYS